MLDRGNTTPEIEAIAGGVKYGVFEEYTRDGYGSFYFKGLDKLIGSSLPEGVGALEQAFANSYACTPRVYFVEEDLPRVVEARSDLGGLTAVFFWHRTEGGEEKARGGILFNCMLVEGKAAEQLKGLLEQDPMSLYRLLKKVKGGPVMNEKGYPAHIKANSLLIFAKEDLQKYLGLEERFKTTYGLGKEINFKEGGVEVDWNKL